MESDYHWLITTGLVASSVIAVTANSFLLCIFCKRRGLRTVPNRFVINLLITNLLSSILLIPLLIIDEKVSHREELNSTSYENLTEEIQQIIVEEDVYTNTEQNYFRSSEQVEINNIDFLSVSVRNKTIRQCMCYFAQSSTNFVCTASIFSILLIGINQYFGVIHSLRYHFYINKCRSMIFILSSWFVALIFGIFGSLTQTDNSLWHFCAKKTTNNTTISIFNTIYAFSYFIIVILVPFLSICVIYVCIYTAAHKNSERMRKSTSASCNANLDTYTQLPTQKNKLTVDNCDGLTLKIDRKKNLPKVHSAPNFLHLIENSSNNKPAEQQSVPAAKKVKRTRSERTTNLISTIKHKISNASTVFRYREETRAAKISFIVIFMVLICYIPYGLTLVLNAHLINVKTSVILNYISLVLLIISNIISPFLFAYRNKRVKREIGRFLGRSKSRKQNRLTVIERNTRRHPVVKRNRSFEDIHENIENNIISEPFLINDYVIPQVIVTCKVETERKSILKRVCNSSGWGSYKKCNFITVPDSCISGEARGSFSSASTQISSEE